MIKSRFRIWAYISVIALVLIPLFGVMIFFILVFENAETEELVLVFCTLIVLVLVSLGEVRTKTISVEVGEDYLIYSRFVGIGKLRSRRFKYFDGYKTSVLTSKAGSYEYLYLIRNDRKIVKLSEFYHANYHDLKSKIGERMANLGFEEFNYLSEIKEIFS